MKKLSTFALVIAMCAAAGATAQTKSMASRPAVDSVLLSETIDGNYLIRRYVIKNHGDSDYSVRYQINLAQLSSTLGGNTKELDNLSGFIGNLMQDSMMNIKTVTITGYASPDGPHQLNAMLAKNRAMNFKNYVDTKYHFSKKYTVKSEWVAEDWEMARALVASSAIPDKAKVLEIIDGTKWTSTEKQAALRRMPAAWDYLKKQILPPLRRVEITINYGEGRIVELRTMIAKPKAEPQPVQTTQPCCEVVDETITGIIVEIPTPARDFDKMTKAEKREFRKAEKLAKQEAQIAQKLAAKEARDATKIAKKAAKEARKMANAAEKAAAKSAKKLNKGMK